MTDTTTAPQPARYLTTAETAKLVRQAVKAAFPGVKFQVRSSNYSLGSSVDVSWDNGPTEQQVDKVVDQYSGADFDGMADIKTYRPAVRVTWVPGSKEATKYGETAEVHMGADYVQCHRTLTDDYRTKLLAEARTILEDPTADFLAGNYPCQDTPYGYWYGGTTYAMVNFLSEHIPA
jgi:hypothetical protein